MNVSSYLELYLTLFGWHMYSVFWDILMDTGIAYMPFVGMFLRNIIEPIKSQDAKDASITSLKRIEIDIFIMFTVIVLAVQPFISIKYNGLNYTKACTAKGVAAGTVKAGKTGTSYDSTFTKASLGGGSVKAPIWWYGALAIIGGFNDAAILKIPCSADIRLLEVKLENARVKDPHLRRQVQQFHKDCYSRARASFLDNPDKYKLPKGMDPKNIDWMGSSYFVGGLYKDIQSQQEIVGFKYNKARDQKYYNPKVYIPVNGRPTCQQWWTGAGHNKKLGLRDALKGQIEKDTMDQLYLKFGGTNKAIVDKRAIRSLISREKLNFSGLRNLNTYNDLRIGNTYNSAVATAGGLLESISFYPKMYMLKTAAPIIQATILMLIYMLLPFYFVFSSYDMGKMIFMTIIIFSVKFWTVLWAVAHWLDNNLLDALMPGMLLSATDALTQNNIVVKMVINFVTGALFVVIPVFWSGLLTWAGHKVGNAMSQSMDNMGKSSGSAGSGGGSATAGAAKSAVKKGK